MGYKKKEFPPGTFLPTGARVLAILQLCMAFTCVVWTLGYPFLGIHFEKKAQRIMYEKVINDTDKFEGLSSSDREKILQDYGRLQRAGTFGEKLKQGLEIFFKRISKFELIWIMLSVVLSIGLLKKREGAVEASWLIPLAALAFAFDNGYYGSDRAQLPENAIFPSENQIVNNYLNEPYSESILKQKEQLLKGWQNYLVLEWAHETPALNSEVLAKQVEKGEFAFDVARLKKMDLDQRGFNLFREKRNPAILWLYVLWNLFFAGYINYALRGVASPNPE